MLALGTFAHPRALRARPAFVGERHHHVHRQAVARERAMHFAVQLPLDDHADQPRAKTETPRPPRRRPVLLDPVENQRHAALGAAHRPAQIELPLGPRQAAVLDRVGGQFVQRRAEIEDRVGLEIDVRTAERDPIEIGPQHDVEQLHDRNRFPAALGDQAVGVGHGEHARLIFAGKIGDAFGVLGGLREQRQQLGKQISRTVAHVADHQFVALLELAALNGAGQDIGGGSEERGVLRAEMARLAGADAEDAVGAAVAAGNGHGHAADAVMILQIGRDGEPGFGGIIGGDDRRGGIQRIARIAIGVRRGQDRADQIRRPAEAGAQQQLGAAGQQFEDLDEVDRQRERDRRDGVVEQPLQIRLDQGALAELRQRLLLLGAAAQLAFEGATFSAVVAAIFRGFRRPIIRSSCLDLFAVRRVHTFTLPSFLSSISSFVSTNKIGRSPFLRASAVAIELE